MKLLSLFIQPYDIPNIPEDFISFMEQKRNIKPNAGYALFEACMEKSCSS